MYWNVNVSLSPSTSICLNRHIGCIETADIDTALTRLALEPTHWMYWNAFRKPKHKPLIMLEPTHWMYWNWVAPIFLIVCLPLEPTHWMYWNSINEIRSSSATSWTDTLDVLKRRVIWSLRWHIYLNRHIGCIETGAEFVLRGWNPLEPTHWMYWNSVKNLRLPLKWMLEPTHWMYWNCHNWVSGVMGISWTDTLDVLKQ